MKGGTSHAIGVYKRNEASEVDDTESGRIRIILAARLPLTDSSLTRFRGCGGQVRAGMSGWLRRLPTERFWVGYGRPCRMVRSGSPSELGYRPKYALSQNCMLENLLENWRFPIRRCGSIHRIFFCHGDQYRYDIAATPDAFSDARFSGRLRFVGAHFIPRYKRTGQFS